MTTTLVLLPGLDGTGVLFEPFVAALPADFVSQVVSYPTDQVLSYDELLKHIAANLPDGPFAVLGESFSGPLALRLAVTAPRVTAVILCATFVRNPIRYIPRSAAFLVSPFWFRLFPAFASVKTLLGGYSTPELRGLLGRAHGLVAPAVLAARARSILHVDAEADLLACKVPIVYLEGENDGVVRRHNIEGIKRLRPDIRIITIPAPHLVLQVAPSKAAAAVAGFLPDRGSL